MDEKSVSLQTLRRLPVYLHYLRTVQSRYAHISATAIAEKLGLNDVQVRKDLAAVSGSGRPKTGYSTDELIGQLEAYLGCTSLSPAVLVGAGNLGKALLSYSGFADYGLEIIAAFDRDAALHGVRVNGKPILAPTRMREVCEASHVRLGIITTPAAAAQQTCDELISYGVRAVWNFAPTVLRVPPDVQVEHENLASSLAVLYRHLRAAEEAQP